MTEETDPFTLELRALVKKYHPDNMGHEITINLPKKTQ